MEVGPASCGAVQQRRHVRSGASVCTCAQALLPLSRTSRWSCSMPWRGGCSLGLEGTGPSSQRRMHGQGTRSPRHWYSTRLRACPSPRACQTLQASAPACLANLAMRARVTAPHVRRRVRRCRHRACKGAVPEGARQHVCVCVCACAGAGAGTRALGSRNAQHEYRCRRRSSHPCSRRSSRSHFLLGCCCLRRRRTRWARCRTCRASWGTSRGTSSARRSSTGGPLAARRWAVAPPWP